MIRVTVRNPKTQGQRFDHANDTDIAPAIHISEMPHERRP